MEINLATLVKHNLTADEYIWMYQKYYGNTFPVKYVLDKEKLQTEGWLKVMPDQIVLRQKTINMFEEGDYVFKEEEESSDVQKIIIKSIDAAKADVKNWIAEYRELFPNKTSGGRLLRATPAVCIKNMCTFIGTNSKRGSIITKEMVINATKEYLKVQAKDGYTYTKAANYFIMKDGDSLLLQHIEILATLGESKITSDGSKNMTDDI